MATLHQRITNDIEGKILAGFWKPGLRIPAEYELEEEYNCSRMTVSKALSVLAQRGMIIRKRGAGSFVAPPQHNRMIMEIQDFEKDALKSGLSYRFEIIDRSVGRSSQSEVDKFGESAGSEVLRTTTLHVLDDEPVALERRIIMLSVVPKARFESFELMPPGSWLLEQVPWSEARHVIRAVSADQSVSRLLAIRRGSACLMLARQTWQNGATITYVELTYPGSKHQFIGTFRPDKA